MKVALFFDGKNFYTALREYDPTLDIDYDKWRSQLDIPEPGPAREKMLDALIGESKVVEGTRESNGQVIKILKLPGG